MFCLSCDPGVTGAVALLRMGHGLLEVADLPCIPSGLETGAMRRFVSPVDLMGILATWSVRHQFGREFVAGVIERPIPMPSMPSTTNASTFDSFGVVRSCFALKANRVDMTTPSEWKKTFGISRDKEESRALALKLYPEAAGYLKTKSSHNRAEAILLAHWLGKKLA